MRREPLKVTQAQFERYRDYVEVFGTDAGKRVLEDLERDCKDGCYVKGDHYATLYISALRDFVDYIKGMMERAEGSEIEKEDD